MTTATDVAIIGAGPYGLSAAAHLRRAGVETRVFGDPMSFWRSMPKGMFLRSNWSATNIAERAGELSLESFQAETGDRFGTPVPLDRFIDYGMWVQRRVAPDVERRVVEGVQTADGGFELTLDGDERVRARRVVVACGIASFAWRPPEFDHLPAELASHTGEHDDLGRFAGQRVAVVGGGQSALESAALLHEAGADVEVHVRGRRIVWLKGVSIHKRIGPRLAGIVYAPTDVGPLWYSRLVASPGLFTKLPRPAQTRIAKRSVRPAGSHWVRVRLPEVPIRLRSSVSEARVRGDRLDLALADGTRTTVDHLLFGTGYRVDVARYPFLGSTVVDGIKRVNGYPILGRGLESSVPGLHFMGAPAVYSVGPIMRFVSGTWYAGQTLTERIAGAGARGTAGSAIRPGAPALESGTR